MRFKDSHLSDQQLLLDVDGELSGHDGKLVRAHLDACWSCRARRGELENAIADFVRVHQRDVEVKLPPIAAPRALLKARLVRIPGAELNGGSSWFTSGTFGWLLTTAACVFLAAGLFLSRSGVHRPRTSRPQAAIVWIPNSDLTPGAAVLASRQAVCAQANTKNKVVPAALQRQVFQEYGIAGAEPRAYEVDYLITPALGGTDDIHNLWPHSYAATAWNAQVKDALEDRLREMVCDGSVDLATAQKDIAKNWIGAYKKYFHTDTPLADHSKPNVQ